MIENFNPQIIGYAHSSFRDKFATPRQPGLVPESKAEIVLVDNLSDGLDGIETFTHIWILFLFHQNNNKSIRTKVHPPRLGGEKMGVFATRSPHRPNPIGLSVVRFVERRKHSIIVSGVDFIEGTPILDIKPYLVDFDCHPDASAGWLANHPIQRIGVEFTDEVLKKIEGYAPRSKFHNIEEFQRLIHQSVELDPRPYFYKGTAENPDPYMIEYGFCIENFNIVFKIKHPKDSSDPQALLRPTAVVIDIQEGFKKT